MNHLVIIGNGIAGITTARYIRKKEGNKRKITIISNESDHFYSRPALMYLYMGHMKYQNIKPYENRFWKKNKLHLVKAEVKHIQTNNKQLILDNGEQMAYDELVIATGSKPKTAGWPGEDLEGVGGMYYIQDVEYMADITPRLNRVVITGGGLIGVEMAEMFRSRDIPVTMLVRHAGYWGSVLPYKEAQMISRHIREHHVDLRLQTSLKEIKGDEQGRVQKIITDKEEEIPCDFVGISIGVTPNIQFVADSEIETDSGILVNEYLETNIPDVYAAGDCAQHRRPLPNRKQVEQVWYTARMMGEVLGETLTGNRTAYHPGIWFNSAKFFDIEYQNYGWVYPETPSHQTDFYWEHESGRIALRIVYNKDDHAVFGINVFGMRLNHEVCEQWIKSQVPVEEVINHLEEARFDPEFYRSHKDEIRAAFHKHQSTPASV